MQRLHDAENEVSRLRRASAACAAALPLHAAVLATHSGGQPAPKCAAAAARPPAIGRKRRIAALSPRLPSPAAVATPSSVTPSPSVTKMYGLPGFPALPAAPRCDSPSPSVTRLYGFPGFPPPPAGLVSRSAPCCVSPSPSVTHLYSLPGFPAQSTEVTQSAPCCISSSAPRSSSPPTRVPLRSKCCGVRLVCDVCPTCHSAPPPAPPPVSRDM
jgi:hypothetical protein